MKLVRRGGGIYLYRSIKRDGRSTSEYLGSGLLALLRAEEEGERRDAERELRERLAELRREHDEIDRGLAEMAREAKAEACRTLEAAGFHQHARGGWRRRRVRAHD